MINMDESRLSTIGQIEEFLSASTQVGFSAHGGDIERYAHISRVLKRFDYPRRNKHERGVLLAYLRHISGYSRPQLTRLVTRWHANRLVVVPLAKRYAAPAAPFAIGDFAFGRTVVLGGRPISHTSMCLSSRVLIATWATSTEGAENDDLVRRRRCG